MRINDIVGLSISNILIVSDNIYGSFALCQMINSYEVRCELVQDPSQTVAKVKAKFERDGAAFDLIIIEVTASSLDESIETTQAVRKYLRQQSRQTLLPDAQLRPFICLLTAIHSKSKEEEAFQKGIDEVLHKPVF